VFSGVTRVSGRFIVCAVCFCFVTIIQSSSFLYKVGRYEGFSELFFILRLV
jgi:hypothetical protein